jgi:hypothetical protein
MMHNEYSEIVCETVPRKLYTATIKNNNNQTIKKKKGAPNAHTGGPIGRLLPRNLNPPDARHNLIRHLLIIIANNTA